MKRPEYIEITIPKGKGTLLPAVKRYFKRLEGKVLKINFGQYRIKKTFEYKILESGLEVGYTYWPRRKHSALKIKAELVKEPEKETS